MTCRSTKPKEAKHKNRGAVTKTHVARQWQAEWSQSQRTDGYREQTPGQQVPCQDSAGERADPCFQPAGRKTPEPQNSTSCGNTLHKQMRTFSDARRLRILAGAVAVLKEAFRPEETVPGARASCQRRAESTEEGSSMVRLPSSTDL